MLILVLLSLAATFIAVALLTNFALFIMIKKTNYAFVLYQSSINLKISIRKLLHGWNLLHSRKGKHVLINTFGKHVDFTI